MMGNKEAAQSSYQEFLTLWQDADPDLPVYREAKAEYAKLQRGSVAAVASLRRQPAELKFNRLTRHQDSASRLISQHTSEVLPH